MIGYRVQAVGEDGSRIGHQPFVDGRSLNEAYFKLFEPLCSPTATTSTGIHYRFLETMTHGGRERRRIYTGTWLMTGQYITYIIKVCSYRSDVWVIRSTKLLWKFEDRTSIERVLTDGIIIWDHPLSNCETRDVSGYKLQVTELLVWLLGALCWIHIDFGSRYRRLVRPEDVVDVIDVASRRACEN